MCMMEACSVCTCSDQEIPQIWLKDRDLSINTSPYNTNPPIVSSSSPAISISTEKPVITTSTSSTSNKEDYGWVKEEFSSFGFDGFGHDESLGKVTVKATTDNTNEINNNDILPSKKQEQKLMTSSLSATSTSSTPTHSSTSTPTPTSATVASLTGIDYTNAQYMNKLQKQSMDYLQQLHATEDCDNLSKFTTYYYT
jgi:hypothetical protein